MTQYSFLIGQIVYYMKKNLIHEGKVVGIAFLPEGFYTYLVEDGYGYREWLKEEYLFNDIYQLEIELQKTMVKCRKEVKE